MVGAVADRRAPGPVQGPMFLYDGLGVAAACTGIREKRENAIFTKNVKLVEITKITKIAQNHPTWVILPKMTPETNDFYWFLKHSEPGRRKRVFTKMGEIGDFH